jgi:hypothetical protein
VLLVALGHEPQSSGAGSPITVTPLSAAVLERDVQPPSESGVLVEEAVHAHRSLRRNVRSWCVFENDGEPPLSRWIASGVAQHGGGLACFAEHDRKRRPTAAAMRLAHLLLRSREGEARLQAACSGPPGDSPSGWPRSHRSPGSMKPAQVVAVDQLGAFAGSTSSAEHQAGCHDRLETLPPTPVSRIRVASSRETGSHPMPAVVRAIPLVLSGCDVLAIAAVAGGGRRRVAAACTSDERDSAAGGCRTRSVTSIQLR